MRKKLIIIVLAFIAMPMLAQTIENLDVSKAQNGKYSTTVNDGIIEGYVMNGQKDGIWMEYHGGNSYLPKKIVSFEKGKKNGIYLELDKTGSITKKAEYKNDILNGQVSEWYRGGRLSKMNTYKNGVMDGEQILCYEKGGNLEVSNYKEGKRDGVTTWFFENGITKMSIEYKGGQFDGKQVTFYPDGSPKSEAVYKNGQLQGKVKTFEEKPQSKTLDKKKKN